MELDHEKRDVELIERANQVREEGIVYGYVNENGNEGGLAQLTGGSDGIAAAAPWTLGKDIEVAIESEHLASLS